MSITQEILRSYRAPHLVMRRLLGATHYEGRALVYLMVACFVIFVGQWPRLSRDVALNPEAPPLDAQVMAAFFAWLIVAPLIFYGIAALSHGVARLLGGQGTGFSARLALFWTMLVVSPLMLLHGLVAGFVGPSPQLTLVGAIVALAFCSVWLISLWEAERPLTAIEGTDL